MLKLLHIQNFQSHKDTTIQFSDGFNVFEGQSDGGKSAIIRAIAAVCYNMWNNQSIRLGQEQTVIQLTTDLGYIKLVKNQKKKINSYTCKKNGCEQQYYETVGTTVPQTVYQITGMRQLNVGDSITDIPNIMFQLEKHYMLAQVNGKSCTSNLIARIFDKVIGLGGMQQLITSISSSMINDKKTITKNMAQIDQLKLKLIEEAQIEQKCKTLQLLKVQKNQIESLQSKIKSINQLYLQSQKQNERIKNLNEKYLKFDVDKASMLIKSLNECKQSYQTINNILVNVGKLNQQLKKSNQVIAKYKNLDCQQVQKLKKLCNKYFIANKILTSYDDKNLKIKNSEKIITLFQKLDEHKKTVQELKSSCNCLYKISKLISKNEQNNKKLKQIQFNVNKYSKLYSDSKTKLNQLKQKYKVCPICGNPFSKCQD